MEVWSVAGLIASLNVATISLDTGTKVAPLTGEVETTTSDVDGPPPDPAQPIKNNAQVTNSASARRIKLLVIGYPQLRTPDPGQMVSSRLERLNMSLIFLSDGTFSFEKGITAITIVARKVLTALVVVSTVNGTAYSEPLHREPLELHEWRYHDGNAVLHATLHLRSKLRNFRVQLVFMLNEMHDVFPIGNICERILSQYRVTIDQTNRKLNSIVSSSLRGSPKQFVLNFRLAVQWDIDVGSSETSYALNPKTTSCRKCQCVCISK